MDFSDIRKISAAALMAFSSAVVMAVPAQRGLRTYTQPDGTTLSVILNGDESFHYYTTSDGLPLMEEQDGTLYFAQIEAGTLCRSDFKACDPSKRTPEIISMLSGFDATRARRLISGNKAAPVRRISNYEGMGRFKTTFPTQGNVRALVILVEYNDVSFQTPDPASYFSDMLNKTGFDQYGGTGCAREYFLNASDGKFDLHCDVYGPVKLPRERSYYGNNGLYGSDSNPEDMVVHAIKLLNDQVDFSTYDCDKDGILDNVFIFYAGQGEASGGPASSVWPHAYELTKAGKSFTVDGVLVDHYACTNEWQKDTPDGIGTFCHEFSHIMGLPDLYPTDGSDCDTPGEWSVMDYGPYNNNSRTPPTYSAYERNALGWLNTIPVEEACSITIDDIKSSNSAVLIPTSRSREFFLLENRQQTGWDKYLPGHGMLIWHVDYYEPRWNSNTVNNDPKHQYVDLVEADPDAGEEAASWPGTQKRTEFTASTTPAFRDWKGTDPGFPVTNITETDGKISIDIDGGDFVLDSPAGLKVAQVTPVSVKVEWEAVERASGYLVSVYTEKDGQREYVRGFNESLFKAPAIQAEVGGMKAETDYVVSVTAVAGSRISTPAVMNVRTPEMSFPYQTPETLEAADVASTSFTARWKPVEGAEAYLITVEGALELKPRKDICDFGSLIFRVPTGWEYSLKVSRYTDPNWCGESVPSAKLDRDGAYLTSPEYEYDIQAVSFWARLSANKPEEAIVAEMLVDGKWTEIARITDLPSEGDIITLSDIPAHSRRLRLTYRQSEGATLALDDVTITVGGVKRTILTGFNERKLGNVTSCLIDNLPEGETGFYYRVAAVSVTGETTFWSPERYVAYSESGITYATADSRDSAVYATTSGTLLCKGVPGSEFEFFTPAGLTVLRGHIDSSGISTVRIPSGIFIVRIGRSVHKIIVR